MLVITLTKEQMQALCNRTDRCEFTRIKSGRPRVFLYGHAHVGNRPEDGVARWVAIDLDVFRACVKDGLGPRVVKPNLGPGGKHDGTSWARYDLRDLPRHGIIDIDGIALAYDLPLAAAGGPRFSDPDIP